MNSNKQIDLQGWIKQVDYANKYGCKLNTVSQWVKRAKEGKGKPKIEYLDVPELGITLVKPI